MLKTAVMKARVEPGLKVEAEKVLSRIGLNTTEAMTIFMRQVVMHNGLPFAVKVPNKKTIAALREKTARYKRYKTAAEALDNLWGDSD